MAPGTGSVYSATKGAVDTITIALSKELGPKGIRVNALNPGLIETEGTHTAGLIGSEFSEGAAKETPLGRIGQPQDVATAPRFLLQPTLAGSTDKPSTPRAATRDKPPQALSASSSLRFRSTPQR